MRVLLIEDETQLAGLVGLELEREFGWIVTRARDPADALILGKDQEFDVAIVDLLYEHLKRDFQARRSAGSVTLTSSTLLVSGLAAVHHLAVQGRTGIVIWTSGEANRRLHLQFAWEDLAVRVFCSKSSGSGRLDTLVEALKAAADGRGHVDPVLNAYMPAHGQPTISSTILRDPARRAFWRALAFGAHTRAQIADITGYGERTVGNNIRPMFEELAALDTGLLPTAAPMAELVDFAGKNWEFFLDDTIRVMYA